MPHRSILIVEDDEALRGAIVAYLEGEGYSVVEAENGAIALDRLRTSGEFCMILLDLFMPVMNGWAFRAEQLRDPALAGIPLMVVTADARAPDKASELGAVAYMAKPLDLERLLALVGEHC